MNKIDNQFGLSCLCRHLIIRANNRDFKPNTEVNNDLLDEKAEPFIITIFVINDLGSFLWINRIVSIEVIFPIITIIPTDKSYERFTIVFYSSRDVI